MSRSLQDTVIAVTGAAGGIGRAICRTVVEAGACVVIVDVDPAAGTVLQDELGVDRAAVVSGDIGDPATSAAMVDTAVERFGRLDSVVANAGIAMFGSIVDRSDADVLSMVNTNFVGTIWATRAAVRRFREQGDGGDIVVIASVAGFRGGATESIYTGTKHGQVGLAGALDREVRAEGIRVTMIAPAGVNTAIAFGTGRTEGDPLLETYLQPEDIAAAVRTTLEQPRRLRTTLWAMYSMVEETTM